MFNLHDFIINAIFIKERAKIIKIEKRRMHLIKKNEQTVISQKNEQTINKIIVILSYHKSSNGLIKYEFQEKNNIYS